MRRLLAQDHLLGLLRRLDRLELPRNQVSTGPAFERHPSRSRMRRMHHRRHHRRQRSPSSQLRTRASQAPPPRATIFQQPARPRAQQQCRYPGTSFGHAQYFQRCATTTTTPTSCATCSNFSSWGLATYAASPYVALPTALLFHFHPQTKACRAD